MKHMTRSHRGFTLVEMVMVIVIIGIISGMVAVFIRAPVQGYFDLETRAGLTDAADTAMRRMGRDMRLALPNSVRSAAANCVEFLPTISGGRYRAELPGNVLNFVSAPTAAFDFDVMGIMPVVPAAGDHMVIYNLGIPGANAYDGNNRAAITSVTLAGGVVTQIRLPANTLFPFESPGKRFHVIPNAERAVSYVCRNAGTDAAGNGTGTVFRVSNYGFVPTPPNPANLVCQATPAGTPVLVQNVSACAFNYAQLVNDQNSLVTMQLSLTRNNETVNLIHEIHVSNVP